MNEDEGCMRRACVVARHRVEFHEDNLTAILEAKNDEIKALRREIIFLREEIGRMTELLQNERLETGLLRNEVARERRTSLLQTKEQNAVRKSVGF